VKPLLYLNLGCGDKTCQAPFPWVNIDSNPVCEPDVVADVRDLPYENGEVDAVYAGHLLEHLSLDEEVPRFLHEVARVLGEYGQVCFVGPDLDRAQLEPCWKVMGAYEDLIERIIKGDETRDGAEHKWIATATNSLLAVQQVFPDAHEVDVETLSTFWPVFNHIGWQFAIVTGEA
jgi:ubiquinone/menaquinone biosynthesis C-methylase UbiE